MPASWDRTTLGRSGLQVGRLGLGASFGVGTKDIERAYERGVNWLYWGSRRRERFGRAIRNIARRDREGLVVVVQSYSRSALAMRASLEAALRRLRIDYADFLLLGWWGEMPPRRIMDEAHRLRDSGVVRHLMISGHNRPAFERFVQDGSFDAIMVRYNAAHRGAETEVFPNLGDDPPGVVAYTATRWGALLNSKLVPPGEPAPRASDCYRFAMSNPHISLSLSGPKDTAELDEALAALDRGPMDEDELAWMRRVGDAIHTAPSTRTWRSPAHLLDELATAVASSFRS